MAGDDARLRWRTIARRVTAVAASALVVMLVQTLPVRALDCLPFPQPLIKVPELVSKDGVLKGTVLLSDQQERLSFRTPPGSQPSVGSKAVCDPQYVRVFQGVGAQPPVPPSVPASPYPDPVPGPTLRARVGDVIELTFLNQINPSDFGNSIDRGENGVGNGCDESSSGYPGNSNDEFPDCFHGSSTGNIHFHGTHTNPNGTADNVFVEVRPSPRVDGKPVVTADSVKDQFDTFFAECEKRLKSDALLEWPTTWNDPPLGPPTEPKTWTADQMNLLQAYDKGKPPAQQLWPVDAAQLAQGAWPQYYIGAYPYCFRLPEYQPTTFPPPPVHVAMQMQMGPLMQPTPPLIMGQSPGTHWYHAHKHGSTAIDVSNGMTGAFIIEGKYDDDLNAFYGENWTRTQPVLVINQLGVTPNKERRGVGNTDKGPDFSINGRRQPLMSMRPSEVQLWRIVNTSPRSGAYFVGPPPGFEWKQLAQDGVQFANVNYQASHNAPFLMAAGNRVDLLVKAPDKPQADRYNVMVQPSVATSDLLTAPQVVMMSVEVSGQAATGPQSQFIASAPTFPPFLADITDSEVKGTKTVVFETNPGPPIGRHTIDGKLFSGDIGEVVLLNTVEEWKVVNRTVGPPIDHPFHIHINPFQVVEVFDPNETLKDPQTGKTVNKYVFDRRALTTSGQCYLNPYGNPEDWKPCDPPPYLVRRNLIWWDVFPIPRGTNPTDASGNLFIDPATRKPIVVPGFFKMRSRFVDYPGLYVMHCHILAHEDRGMMSLVEVAPFTTAMSHQ